MRLPLSSGSSRFRCQRWRGAAGGNGLCSAAGGTLSRAISAGNRGHSLSVDIEQNAQVYSRVFGQDALLEHHSGSIQKLAKHDEEHFIPAADKEDEEEKKFQETGLRSKTENWDAPLIVTTSVRFFESLF